MKIPHARKPQHKGAVSALRDAGFRKGENLDIVAYHMDTKQKNNADALLREQAEAADEVVTADAPRGASE